ncbi:hypothetical protein CLV30_12575 [Haloactinopolyspora alba]|uniref:Major capsid protein n=1 Tax=Haloactinopolyspora alba TaxID=648780 RepID=A0A2P8DHL3_9ACTN|nr:DUF5309 family protein [Haloactinopolyspora alba]PSK96693.1 hypothetical protein CLV30_12575 [Haloactinopolyspora alba]
MAGIAGQGTTFNLPNYVGELFAVTPTDTPFLSSIGGLTGGESAASVLFQWTGYDLRNADKNRQRTEGANAPTPENRTRFNVTNVVEVHQESVDISYTKLAATGQFNSTGSNHPGAVGVAGSNPVLDEMDWQVRQALVQIARDIEKGFIGGTFQNPSDNSQPRKTRGILQATQTNASDQAELIGGGGATIATDGTVTETNSLTEDAAVSARALTGGAVGVLDDDHLYYAVNVSGTSFQLATKPGGAPITFGSSGGADFYKTVALTEPFVLDLLQDVWDNGGIMEQETATLMANSTLKRALTKIFVTDKNYQEQTRNVGGVAVQTIETDFGTLNIMLNRYMPSGALEVVSLEECAPVFLPIPGKGFLFQEPLAKDGAAEREQIYGEVGLKYGNEKAHGKLLGIHRASA